jgi:hypothetical protein
MEDTVIRPESITEQAKPLNNKMVDQLKEVAHMGMLEAPTRTQTSLLRFLQNLP